MMDDVRHPDAPEWFHPGRYRPVGEVHRHLGLGVRRHDRADHHAVHPVGVGRRPVGEVHLPDGVRHLGVGRRPDVVPDDLLWRMGCWPREVRVHLAWGLALPSDVASRLDEELRHPASGWTSPRLPSSQHRPGLVRRMPASALLAWQQQRLALQQQALQQQASGWKQQALQQQASLLPAWVSPALRLLVLRLPALPEHRA